MSALVLADAEIFDGVRTLPGRWDVTVDGGRLRRIVPADSAAPDTPAAFRSVAVLPGLVDAHVHLAFANPGDVARGAVASVLDLGAPLATAFEPAPPLRVRASGPLVTAPGGYPTRSWGADGFGLEIDGEAQAREAVAKLADRGAAMIKIALQGTPRLDAATASAVVAAAHARGLRVVAHAVTAASVAEALGAGVDALAHTPVEPLSDETIEAIASREMSVISTVRAFGDSAAARANLAGLAAAGCRVVYGTDLGNDGIAPGADALELEILAGALGGFEAALRAATCDAAAFAGFPDPSLREGDSATLVVAARLDAASIAEPLLVMIDGKPLS